MVKEERPGGVDSFVTIEDAEVDEDVPEPEVVSDEDGDSITTDPVDEEG